MQVNSEDPDQMPHSVASDQGLHCLPMSHKRTLGLYGLKMQLQKRTLGLYGLKMQLFYYLIRVPEIWEVDC